MNKLNKYLKRYKKRDKINGYIISGASLLTAVLMRRIIEFVWKKIAKNDPPKNPASHDVAWQEATAFTLVTALMVGLAKLLVRRNVTFKLEDRF